MRKALFESQLGIETLEKGFKDDKSGKEGLFLIF